MTAEEEDTIYAAYLGLCKFKRCANKWGKDSDVDQADILLKEMSDRFPFIAKRVALSVLRA